jgi:DNA-binding NarL/FixJ family response regulator
MVSCGDRRLVPDLLERDELIAGLDERIASVRTGSEGMFVWIGGEAGVGKTALLRHFCARQVRPVRILWGACEPLRTPRPLGPFVDVAEATGGELADLIATGPRPYEVAAAVLDELRGRVPTVLVLEDLQWADEATLDVITLLATRIGSAPALAIADADDDDALRQAVEELQSLGARPAAAIVARRLRRRGIRGVPRGPRKSTRENPAGLTARELEVLAMLAEGLRNADIAERLVLSEKTVDHHVSAILRKLNVRTRGEAAAEAARLGLISLTQPPRFAH